MTNPPKPSTSKKKDRRITVVVGTKKGKTAQDSVVLYTRVLKSIADYFGFVQAPNAVHKQKNKNKPPRRARGSVGAGSIKIVLEETTKSGANKTKSIPMPSGMTLDMMTKFLQSAKSNKPKQFISKNGLTYDLSDKGK